MSETSDISHVEAADLPFSSLAALRIMHFKLLQRHRAEGDTSEVISAMMRCIEQGRRTGALLDNEEERWAAQSLLDYWSTVLQRIGKEGRVPVSCG